MYTKRLEQQKWWWWWLINIQRITLKTQNNSHCTVYNAGEKTSHMCWQVLIIFETTLDRNTAFPWYGWIFRCNRVLHTWLNCHLYELKGSLPHECSDGMWWQDNNFVMLLIASIIWLMTVACLRIPGLGAWRVRGILLITGKHVSYVFSLLTKKEDTILTKSERVTLLKRSSIFEKKMPMYQFGF